MGEMIARRAGFDTWPLSLVKDPSRIEFVVKYNGYTMTIDWAVASGFWLRPTSRWQLPSSLPKKIKNQQPQCAAHGKEMACRQISRVYKNPASLLTSFFFFLNILPLSSYRYTDLPLVLPILRLPSRLTHIPTSLLSYPFFQLPFNLHILLSLTPDPQDGAQEDATQAVSSRGAPTDARTSGRKC